MDSHVDIRPGISGGIVWPTALHPGLTKAERLTQRQRSVALPVETPLGIYCYLPASQALELIWVQDCELVSGIRPLKNQADAKLRDEIIWYQTHEDDTPVPWELLHSLLAEEESPSELRSATALQSTRICVASIHNTDFVLLAHAYGKIRETPQLSVLRLHGQLGQCKLETTCEADSIRHPIQELAFSSPLQDFGFTLDSLPFLAARTWYWLSVFRVAADALSGERASMPDDEMELGGPSSAVHQWHIEAVGTLQQKSRITHMSWNPCIPHELAFASEDGCIGFTNVLQGAAGCKPNLSARTLRAIGDQQGKEPSVSGLEWALHPRLVYFAEGRDLQRLDFRDSRGQPVILTLHSRPKDESIVGLKRPDKHANYLAVCTTASVLLIDVCRPQNSLLKWQLSLSVVPPPILDFHLHFSQSKSGPSASRSQEPKTIGCISVASLGTGDNLAFRFCVLEDGIRMWAEPSTERDSMGEEGQAGNIAVRSVFDAVRGNSSQAAFSLEGDRFSWVPRLCDRAYSLDMPQRLAVSLKERRRREERHYSLGSPPEFDSETSRALGAAPDIQGFSIVPGCQQGAGDSVLARIDFLGNVFLDSCVLFRTSAPPSKTTFPPHRVLLTEPREVSDDENSWATASSEEPESEEDAEQQPNEEGSEVTIKPRGPRSYRPQGQPAGPLQAIPSLLRRVADRHNAAEQFKSSAMEASEAEALSVQQQQHLAGLINEMEVPMTVAELKRGLRMRASAAEAVYRGLSVAQPVTAATHGKVPSLRHSKIMGAEPYTLQRKHSSQPAELLFWPGAWRLAQLERDIKEMEGPPAGAILEACKGLPVRLAEPMRLAKPLELPGAGSSRNPNTFEGRNSSGEALDNTEEGNSEAPGRNGTHEWPEPSEPRQQDHLQVVLPAKSAMELLGPNVFNRQAKSEEARSAIEQLAEAWPVADTTTESPMEVENPDWLGAEGPRQQTAGQPGTRPAQHVSQSSSQALASQHPQLGVLPPRAAEKAERRRKQRLATEGFS